MTTKSILLLGVDMRLFKACFGSEEAWNPYELLSLSEDCSSSELSEHLNKQGLCSVVIQDCIDLLALHLGALKDYYNSGGIIAYFGISGGGSYVDRDVPGALCSAFELPHQWIYSGYTKHHYELTHTAMDSLGFNIRDQQYSKANLLSVPIQDRWMVPKAEPLHIWLEDKIGLVDGEEPDDEWKAEAERTKKEYVAFCEGLYKQCPLAVHKNKDNGKLAYMGFVNGDGNIPKIVKGLLTRTQIR